MVASPSHPAVPIGEHLSRLTGPIWIRVAVGLLLAVTLVRFVVSGPLVYLAIPANVQNLGLLFDLIVDGTPVTRLCERCYGVVAWLLYDPAIRAFGRDPLAINLWGLALSLLIAAGSFVLVAIRLGVRGALPLAAMAIGWTGFLPLVSTVAERSVDLFNHAALAVAFFLYTGAPQLRAWSGVAVAAGALAKFLPGLFIPFFLVRERRAFAYGLAAIAVLVLVGQLLYGPLMGVGYFTAVAGATSVDAGWSQWHEGFSPRQLLFKVAAGYRLENVSVAPPNQAALSLIAYALELGFVAYLLYVAVRSRGSDGLERRAIEFAFGITTIYMVSPTVGHEHIVAMIIVYTVLAWYWLRRPGVSWGLAVPAAVSLLMVGVYLPMPILDRILPLDAIMRLFGNEATAPWIFDYPIAEYDFLGIPGYGAIIAWIVLAVLERRTRAPRPSRSELAARSDRAA